tara:strand:+ start:496 stop:684 length:189 start_codon:yes stop_codon:yes gene_type:complete
MIINSVGRTELTDKESQALLELLGNLTAEDECRLNSTKQARKLIDGIYTTLAYTFVKGDFKL